MPLSFSLAPVGAWTAKPSAPSGVVLFRLIATPDRTLCFYSIKMEALRASRTPPRGGAGRRSRPFQGATPPAAGVTKWAQCREAGCPGFYETERTSEH